MAKLDRIERWTMRCGGKGAMTERRDDYSEMQWSAAAFEFSVCHGPYDR
jgi:hypothetical protein